MPRIERTESALILPRPLVNQLLRIAQSAPTGTRWGIIGANKSQPVHCYPFTALGSAQFNDARRMLEQHGETLFAVYRIDTDEAGAPGPAELDAVGIPATVFLDVSLGTKGVLQLRGWRMEARRLVEVDITIGEV